ncbi:hypothetical protein HW560_05955 [Paenibacillus sp. E222]|uniref:DUF6338 family protein n=1 Tax=Paenibacillus sp. E222 TaxID=2748863 RepID=UPI0015C5C9A2|nr:DUF6338 family protein [Paenibacillus sp. E222]QLG37694.1 hypothetical protein HW560_05955 [Paenibacillus sp. E222]
MELSELFVRMLLVFFPGIIAAKIVDMLTDHERKDIWAFFLNAFVLGMGAYFTRYLIIVLINLIPRFNYKVYFLNFLTDSKLPIVWIEIVWTTVTAIFLGFIVTFVITHRLVYGIARSLKISKKFAEEDVWGYVFNNDSIRWVTLRDFEKKLIYEGWVEAFSQVHVNSELFIRDVTVYDMENVNSFYNVDAMYVSRNHDNITIEFRTIQ